MSDAGNDRPQDMTTPVNRRCSKGPDSTIICSLLIIAAAATVVYFVPGKDYKTCCNFAQVLNITQKLSALEVRIEDIQRFLEQEKQREGKVQACKKGWIRHGDKCYYFSKEKHTWSTSLLKCRDEGGYLAEINSDDENTFIKEQAILLNEFLWLGGSDQLKESDWIWVTSKKHFSSGLYVDWQRGQPSNSGHGENCLHLHTDHHGYWNDACCSTLLRYLCETEADITTK